MEVTRPFRPRVFFVASFFCGVQGFFSGREFFFVGVFFCGVIFFLVCGDFLVFGFLVFR